MAQDPDSICCGIPNCGGACGCWGDLSSEEQDWADLSSVGEIESEPEPPTEHDNQLPLESAICAADAPLLAGVDVGLAISITRPEFTTESGVRVHTRADRVLCCKGKVRVLFHWQMPQTERNPTPFEAISLKVLDNPWGFENLLALTQCINAGQLELCRISPLMWDRFYALRCGWITGRGVRLAAVKKAKERIGLADLLSRQPPTPPPQNKRMHAEFEEE